MGYMVTGEIMNNGGIHIARQKKVALQIPRLLHNNTSPFPNGGIQSIGALPDDPGEPTKKWRVPSIQQKEKKETQMDSP